jgi:hypothetical protein
MSNRRAGTQNANDYSEAGESSSLFKVNTISKKFAKIYRVKRCYFYKLFVIFSIFKM